MTSSPASPPSKETVLGMRDASFVLGGESSGTNAIPTILDEEGSTRSSPGRAAGDEEEAAVGAASVARHGEQEDMSRAVGTTPPPPPATTSSPDTIALNVRKLSSSTTSSSLPEQRDHDAAESRGSRGEQDTSAGHPANLPTLLPDVIPPPTEGRESTANSNGVSPLLSRGEGDGNGAAANNGGTSIRTIVPDPRHPLQPSSPSSSPIKVNQSLPSKTLRGEDEPGLHRFKTAASVVKTTEAVVSAIQSLSLASDSESFQKMRQDAVLNKRNSLDDVVTSTKASIKRLEKMLEGTASRSALQLALCACLGMWNYSEPTLNDVLPFSTFQIITYIFLSESTAGLIVVKSMNRVLGTLVGAALGWVVIMIMSCANGVNFQRLIAGVLVAATLAGGQYCKTRYDRPYAYTMFNLTFWLVIALNWQVDGSENIIETSIRIPLWRFVQVCVGCAVIVFVSNNFFPNYERLMLRRKAGGLITKLATQVTNLVNVLVDEDKEAPTVTELSSLVTAAAGLKGSMKNAAHEVFIFAPARLRFFRAASWSMFIPELMELAACVQSLGVLVSDHQFNRDLTDESTDVRGGVQLLGDQLVQCLLLINAMIISKQTANTHALGAIHNLYDRWNMKRSFRKGNDSGGAGGGEGDNDDPLETYVQNLASFMDEMDLAEVLIASLTYKIQKWHSDYLNNPEAKKGAEEAEANADAYAIAVSLHRMDSGSRSGKYVLVDKIAAEDDWGGGIGKHGGGERGLTLSGLKAKASWTYAVTSTKELRKTNVLSPDSPSPAMPSTTSPSTRDVSGIVESLDLGAVLDDMVFKSLNRGKSRNKSSNRKLSVEDAEMRVRYLNSFLTTAGIMLRSMKRMLPLLVKLGPEGMKFEALSSMRSIVREHHDGNAQGGPRAV